MMDREEIIRGLNCCAHTDGINCLHCPYDHKGDDCTALMAMDVLALLKEQEKEIESLNAALENISQMGHC